VRGGEKTLGVWHNGEAWTVGDKEQRRGRVGLKLEDNAELEDGAQLLVYERR